jgi:hypothetical protein
VPQFEHARRFRSGQGKISFTAKDLVLDSDARKGFEETICDRTSHYNSLCLLDS